MEIEKEVLLAPFTTFQIGGRARFLIRIRTLEDLEKALAWGAEKNLPLLVLGGGSNLLINDEGFSGLVIKVEISGVLFKEEGDAVEAIAGAGESWDSFVAQTVARGFFGLENLSGIPGTVGGTPIQNVGAYGAEVGNTIVWVEAMHMKTRERRLFQNSDCQFGYRTSYFKTIGGQLWVVTRVAFHLAKNGTPNLSYREVREYFSGRMPEPTLQEIRQAILNIRGRKFPDLTVVGTAGSFFKNPTVSEEILAELLQKFPDLPHFPLPGGDRKIALGALLERLKWKGVRRGKAGAFEKQSLVLGNHRRGTGRGGA